MSAEDVRCCSSKCCATNVQRCNRQHARHLRASACGMSTYSCPQLAVGKPTSRTRNFDTHPPSLMAYRSTPSIHPATWCNRLHRRASSGPWHYLSTTRIGSWHRSTGKSGPIPTLHTCAARFKLRGVGDLAKTMRTGEILVVYKYLTRAHYAGAGEHLRITDY
jgi:hypothetical protein